MVSSRVWTLLLLATLTGCERNPMLNPDAYKSPWDRFVVRTGLTAQGFYPCSRRRNENGAVVIEPIPSEDCYRLDPPRRMAGVWLVEFEGSSFLPGASKVPDWRSSEDDIWLEYDWRKVPPGSRARTNAYFIEFIGRKSSYPDSYGHLGGSRHLVIVDRLISIRPLPPARRLITLKDERGLKVDVEFDRCRDLRLGSPGCEPVAFVPPS